MRILYGIVGEGMGHATRSRVLIEHLLGSGHEILIVVSGRAHAFITKKFKNQGSVQIEEIHGLHFEITMTSEGGELDKSETLLSNLEAAPSGLRRNLEQYRKIADGFDAQLVISDFESWAYFYARAAGLPVVSIDNMQILNRCDHDAVLRKRDKVSFHMAKLAVKAKLPGAYHYLVTSFFFPPVRKERTTLIPPILRDEVLRAQRLPGKHVVVYSSTTHSAPLLPLLKRHDAEFRVYGGDREGEDGNVVFRPFSETGFIQDLCTARAVVGGAGFSLMSEAVHLGVPMLAVPIKGQFEQGLNARWLEHLGYGEGTEKVDDKSLGAFLEKAPSFDEALATYPRQDNSKAFACLDELVRDVSVDEQPPLSLEADNMGTWTR